MSKNTLTFGAVIIYMSVFFDNFTLEVSEKRKTLAP